jgi:uncharacterized membrane protein
MDTKDNFGAKRETVERRQKWSYIFSQLTRVGVILAVSLAWGCFVIALFNNGPILALALVAFGVAIIAIPLYVTSDSLRHVIHRQSNKSF